MKNSRRTSEQDLLQGDANQAFLNYFRCGARFAPFYLSGTPSAGSGFFRFGSAVCFGSITMGQPASNPINGVFDAKSGVCFSEGNVGLPFNPTEVVENLLFERYTRKSTSDRLSRRFYYSLRPALPFEARKLLQRAVSRGRRKAAFPKWPLDCSVEQIFKQLMEYSIRATGETEIPFIWFWPEKSRAAVMMTHDVEEANGAAHCEMLMDVDDSFGVKSAFQLIPEGRYEGFEGLVASIRSRGFETNIHDLDHDGRLYDDISRFQQRARKINDYARTYGMNGFRAGAMHRNQAWFHLLDFRYDMSVPNVSHLEPQQGGCCTVMPYFLGKLLELPLTTVQDHGLFHILGHQTIDLWKLQIDTIYEHHGLISFIVHPDYVVRPVQRRLYCELLRHIESLRNERPIWWALPGEIDQWWRQRSQMRLVPDGGTWQIQGSGSERASIAYATLVNGELTYRISDSANLCATESTPSGRAGTKLQS